MRRFKVQVLIFVVLFLFVEIILRLFGMKAGTLIDDFKVEEEPVYQKRFASDEMGINHIVPEAENLMFGSKVNGQGFRGSFNYTPAAIDSVRKNTRKEILMMIGDSYVEGCCPDSVSNSFPDLIAKHSNFEVLNFGVSGTDPIQYELITKKYVKQLKPDRVIVVFYFGNDILNFKRAPTPGIPLNYPFKNNKWIYGVAPNHLSGKINYTFSNPEEAYNFYIEHYTLEGKSRNLFEKLISPSILFSKLYLYFEHTVARYEWERRNSGLRVNTADLTNSVLRQMVRTFDSLKVPYLFVGIPAPKEAAYGTKLTEKYKMLFRDIPWSVPTNLTLSDYDGASTANHFNNKGHRKFEIFLLELLKSEKNKANNRDETEKLNHK